MRLFLKLFCVTIAMSLSANSALADECRGVVIKTIPGNDLDGKKGTVLELIHAYEGKTDGTPLTYGGHGGGIYPADHVKILNCTMRKINTEPYFDLVLTDTPENAHEILYQSIMNKLVNAGLDYANASNAASSYLEQPRKACSLMIKRALDGDPAAISLIRKTGICQPK